MGPLKLCQWILTYLVISDSRIKGKTGEAVDIVKNKLRIDNDSRLLIEKLGELTSQTATALKDDDSLADEAPYE